MADRDRATGGAAVTPLAARLRERIAADGPVTVEYFMQLCLGDPVHGYYMTRDPIGAGGDFTTAPEISQMFGEMIGVWALDSWQKLGAPDLFHLVELGPGRGTLMADLLRAARAVPDFLTAGHIHLVETSPVLRRRQAAALQPFLPRLQWHDSLATLPAGPTLCVANEFFDALPIRQWLRVDAAWHERTVALDQDQALHLDRARRADPTVDATAADGAILERSPAGEKIMAQLARRIVAQRGAALVIDYGHVRSGFGDTLQAVRRHAFADILAEPGEADLTAHVDFERLAAVARSQAAAVAGPVTQGAFLRAMGIAARADALRGRASDAQRRDIDAALERLTDAGSEGMGALFKVLAIADPHMPALAGF